MPDGESVKGRCSSTSVQMGAGVSDPYIILGEKMVSQIVFMYCIDMCVIFYF